MRVKWTVSKGLWSIPERFWGEDLSLLDKNYSGEVIDIHTDWIGETTLTVMCDDDKLRQVEYSKVTRE